jgi:hypothetical protein
MKKTILVLALLSTTAYAATPTGALNTRDVGLDQAGVCWHRGPANVLAACSGTASGITVIATTVLPSAGYWLVIPATGAPTVVNADGLTTAAGAIGTAFPIVSP